MALATGAPLMAAALRAQGLSKTYRRRQVVRDVSLEVHPAQIVGLLGPNGAGKTTSFNMVAGLTTADGGDVFLGDHNLRGLPLHRRARLGLAYLPQEPTVLAGLTAAQNLTVALEILGYPRRDIAPRVAEALQDAALHHVACVPGASLSGGERRRLEMARALLLEPKVLLLDEPFAGVDPIAVAALQASIREVAKRGIGVLITDHNVQETLRLCDRAYLMAQGTIIASGRPEDIVADATVRRVYLGDRFKL